MASDDLLELDSDNNTTTNKLNKPLIFKHLNGQLTRPNFKYRVSHRSNRYPCEHGLFGLCIHITLIALCAQCESESGHRKKDSFSLKHFAKHCCKLANNHIKCTKIFKQSKWQELP